MPDAIDIVSNVDILTMRIIAIAILVLGIIEFLFSGRTKNSTLDQAKEGEKE